MRITELHAENYLSFGCGNDRMCFKPNMPLTVLVGPNGSGKTNIIRVVKELLTHLEETHSEVATNYHRPDGVDKRIELAVALEFDANDQAFIHTYLNTAMCYPSNSGDLYGLATVKNEQDHEIPSQVRPERLAKYAALLDTTVTVQEYQAFYKGWLRLIYDPDRGGEPDLVFEMRVRPEDGGAPALVLDIRDGVIRSSMLGQDFPNTGISRAYVDTYGERQREQLGRFLHGEDVDLPKLEPHNLWDLLPTISQRGRAVTTTPQNDNAIPVPTFRRLRASMQYLGTTTRPRHLGEVLRAIIRSSVIVLDNWQEDTTASLLDAATFEVWAALISLLTQGEEERHPQFNVERAKEISGGSYLLQQWLDPLAVVLHRGNLPLYLLRLQLGSDEERKIYKGIEAKFTSLMDLRFRLRLSVDERNRSPFRYSLSGTQVRISLETEDGVALDAVGSGVTQAMHLAAALTGLPGSVVFLDEPEMHLHPNVKARITPLLGLQTATQYVVVAHSPYVVPNPIVDSARRMLLADGVSKMAGEIKSEDKLDQHLRIHSRAHRLEDKAFLFGNVCCFIEGPNDANAYVTWFDEWAQRNGKGQNFSARQGIVFQVAGGKGRVGEMVLVAEKYFVPAIGVVDTDLLLDDGNATHNESRRGVLSRWEQMRIIEPGTTLGSLESLRGFSTGRIRVLQPEQDADVDWRMDIEKLFEAEMNRIPFEDGRGAPSTYAVIAQRWWPERYAAFLESLFSDLVTLAPSGPAAK